MIMNQVLGGKSDSPSGGGGNVKRLDQGHGSVEDAVASINAMLSF
jgi:hypothetical protein